MTREVPLALPWYHPDDYPALLALFSDPDKLPKTFEAWLQQAGTVEKRSARTPLPSSVYSPVSVGWPNTVIRKRSLGPRL
jgi:hypothetical protein